MRAVMCERFGVYEATQLYYVALGCFVVVGELVGHLYKIDCYVYIILCVVCIVDERKMAAAITNDIILSRTGREFGPDFMLNVEKTGPAGPIITTESSITEVLNIVGYLCNTTRGDNSTINGEGSLDKMAYGVHDATGVYQNGGVGAAAGTLYTSAPNQLIDLDTLNTTAAITAVAAGVVANAFIPQGILPRAQDAMDPHAHTPPIDIAAVATRITLMSDCVKQMINILENTRTIFGPKGWTALFSKVKGGGGAKRTHRQHRRKYSSKHY